MLQALVTPFKTNVETAAQTLLKRFDTLARTRHFRMRRLLRQAVRQTR